MSTKKQSKKDLVTCVRHLISDYKPTVIVDSHMHIQSGNCAPLPFFWGTLGPAEKVRMSRGVLEGAGKALKLTSEAFMLTFNLRIPGDNLGKTTSVSEKDTDKIGAAFMKKRNEVYEYFKTDKLYRRVPHIEFPCFVMTMDMEYAHIDGYFGLKVYNVIYREGDREKKPIRYWMPLHGRWIKDDRSGDVYVRDNSNPIKLTDIEQQTQEEFDKSRHIIEGTGLWGVSSKAYGVPGIYYDANNRPRNISVMAAPCLLPKEETKRYEQWKDQVFRTELSVVTYPLKLLPMFHYDPRRWQVADNRNHPFNQVSGSGLYLGFKIYTAQGYRPWDVRRLPILKEFYQRCCTGKIPIMNHCTPDGAPSFDRGEYVKFRHPMDNRDDDIQKSIHMKTLFKPDVDEYFNDFFVSPRSWEQVLEGKVGNTRLRDLRLCLAHFGGGKKGIKWIGDIIALIKKYPHVYADISSSMTNKEFKEHFKTVIARDNEFKTRIRKRILFGTDWYLTMMDDFDYMRYCKETKRFLDDIDPVLWIYFTQANPYRFYRLDQQIRRIAENIIKKRNTDKEIYELIPKLEKSRMTKIRKDAAFIEQANKSFVIYQETCKETSGT